MKKSISVVLIVVMCVTMLLVGCGQQPTAPSAQETKQAVATQAAAATTGAPAATQASGGIPRPAADVAEQGYDFYKGAVSWKDAEAQLGAIPKPKGPIKLGFVCKAFENEFWLANKQGAEAAAAEFKKLGMDITYDVRAAQGESDEQGQLAILNDMANKGYNGIVLSPISEGNLLPGVEKAVAKNIPMVVNNDAFMPEIDVTTGVWHWEGGLLAAKWIDKKLGGKGKVAIIQGNLKTPPARSRTDAFVKYFKDNNPNVKIVDVQQADWDRMKAKDLADTWLKKYPDLDAIFCNNDTMAMGAVEAAKAANKKIVIVGIDGTGEALKAIKSGDLAATVSSFPTYLSQISTEMVLRKLGGQKVPKVIYTPQAIIDSTNLDADFAKIIGWNGFNFEK